MPIQQSKREQVEEGKDWIRFKFSPGLWDNFLQKCVAGGEDVDEIASQLISEWCEIEKNEAQTQSEITDQDKLKKEFDVLLEDLSNGCLPFP